MPLAVIKKAAKQTGRSIKKLENMWNKIEKSVKENKKYKGMDKDRKYAIIMGSFIKSSGYKPAQESIMIIVPLKDVDEDSIVAEAKEYGGANFLKIDIPIDGINESFMTFRVTEKVQLKESTVFSSIYSIYDDFTSVQYCISNITRKVMSKVKQDFDGNLSAYDERYEKEREKIKEKILESLRIPGNVNSNRVFQIDEKDFDDVKCLEDEEGFHILWSPQAETTSSFFHCLYAIDKDTAIRLIKEGLLFSIHRYFTYKSFGA